MASNAHPAPNSKSHPVVCVFCGASPGISPLHLEAARSLAQALHASNTHLVYGGGTLGVMGALAQELVRLSGPDSVTGIIPRALMEYEQRGSAKVPSSQNDSPEKKKVELPDPSMWGRTVVVETMHARKALMSAYVHSGSVGSGFIALTGGYGTLEELMEIVTWNQLGIHDMPIIVYNVNGYWDGILSWVKNAVSQGFISQSNGGIIFEGKSADEVIKGLKDYRNSEGKMKLRWEEVEKS